jgi:hypothetical protein
MVVEDAMEAVLDKFGRIVIPKQVRDDLGPLPPPTKRVAPFATGALAFRGIEEIPHG